MRTQREVSGVEEGTKQTWTPEHTETPEYQEMRSTQMTRRKSFEQTGTRMHTPLQGVHDLAAEYEKRGWRDIERQHGAAGPSMYEYSHLAEHGDNPFPMPTRWEDLSDDEQARTHAALAAHGTTLNRMVNDLGRGLDRAYQRGTEQGSVPYAAPFYEPHGFARAWLSRAMPEAPGEHAAAAIAMTSPQNKFAQVTHEGNVVTSNINAAAAAGSLAYSGDYETHEQFAKIPGELLKQRGSQFGYGGIGLHGNVRKAAWGLHQGHSGVPVEEWRGLPSMSSPAGKQIFGESPKASPFAGSFVDEAAPFHVLDVHMAGIAFPHLSSIKGSGTNINPSGASVGNKSERELAVDRIPNVHAAADFAMRQAMGERDLHKIRFQQGAGWGEEQIHRTLYPEPGARALSYHPERVYGWQQATMPGTSFTRRTKRGVGDLYLPG